MAKHINVELPQAASTLVTETVVGTSAFFEPLSAHDRCDTAQCGAQAYVRVQFRVGELLFCAHHYQDAITRSVNLERDALTIHDERAKLGGEGQKLDVSA